jgi:hypothetical protein
MKPAIEDFLDIGQGGAAQPTEFERLTDVVRRVLPRVVEKLEYIRDFDERMDLGELLKGEQRPGRYYSNRVLNSIEYDDMRLILKTLSDKGEYKGIAFKFRRNKGTYNLWAEAIKVKPRKRKASAPRTHTKTGIPIAFIERLRAIPAFGLGFFYQDETEYSLLYFRNILNRYVPYKAKAIYNESDGVLIVLRLGNAQVVRAGKERIFELKNKNDE